MRRIRPLAVLCVVGLVWACEGGNALHVASVEGSFDPPLLDFGRVPIGLSKVLPVRLMNTGSAPFTLDDVVVPGPFSIRSPTGLVQGEVLSPGAAIDLEITYVAIEEGALSRPLLVHSGDTMFRLDLVTVGVYIQAPQLEATPTVLDFGTVDTGMPAYRTLSIFNKGNAAGTITGIQTGDDLPFRVTQAWPLQILPEGIAVMEVAFEPEIAGSYDGSVAFTTAETTPDVVVEVRGIGRGGEDSLRCTPSTVDFGPVARGQSKVQSVTCTATGESVRITTAGFAAPEPSFLFGQTPSEIVLAPGESTTFSVVFRPEGLPRTVTSALVVEHGGGPLTVPLSGRVEPPPPEVTSITARLGWDSDFVDVDLHLIQPGGEAFSRNGGDCFWAVPAPDWGELGDHTDDPYLDRDDVDGYGPETINLARATPGTYELYVHYFADRSLGPTNAEVEVFIGGSNVGTFRHPGLSCNDWWHVGSVQWDGVSGQFVPDGRTIPVGAGSCL